MRRSLLTVGLIAAALWSIQAPPSIATPAPPTEALVMLDPPEAAPATTYVAAGGAAASLADHAGKVVVLNFWATWCAPCVRELPSLDRLAAALPRENFAVLALSTDRGGDKKAGPFLEKLEIERLAADLDPKSALARALGLRGLPTTFVIDPDGKVVAKLEGIAEWDSPEFVAWFKSIAE